MKSKKIVFLLYLIFFIVSYFVVAGAEALDITSESTFYTELKSKNFDFLHDGKYTTFWESSKENDIILNVSSKKAISNIYICFAKIPNEWSLEYKENDSWKKAYIKNKNFLHNLINVNSVYEYRIIAHNNRKDTLKINELYNFTKGDLPNWVQDWQEQPQKVDLMLLVAHPDDEYIFFGGLIPYYQLEKNKNVLVAYLTSSNTTRSSELLNGLWNIGYKSYPVIGDFPDSYSRTLHDAYVKMKGFKARNFVIETVRKYKPDIIVSHDINGEYGHGAHKAAADLAIYAFENSANDSVSNTSLNEYGKWQVQKLYLHLYEQNQIFFDWDNMQNTNFKKTYKQLSKESLDFHITQKNNGQDFENLSKKFNYGLFGLYKSNVGNDILHEDFFENVVPGNQNKKVINLETIKSLDNYPKLNDKKFLEEGEFVYEDIDNGIWIYISDKLNVEIQRLYDPIENITWYEADILSDVSKGQIFSSYDNRVKGKRKPEDPSRIARDHSVVFAINSDYYSYRVGSQRKRGIDIRNYNEVIFDDPYTSKTFVHPNLDIIAFFDDGNIRTYPGYKYKAKDFIDMNAKEVYSFGPYFIKDGIENEYIRRKNAQSFNPRTAFGMVEPGHYVAIVAEGRVKRSKGVNYVFLLDRLKDKNCVEGFNFDGGQTSVMVFMGKQLNLIGFYDGKLNPRRTTEILGIGQSDKVIK